MPQPHPLECRGCPLDLIGTGFAQPEGTGVLGVAIIGEALGASEAAQSLPFRPFAEAGSVLERAIKKAGFSRQQFVLQNIVNCQPPFNKLEGAAYEAQAISHCRVHFDRVVNRFKPGVFLSLGSVALRTLTGLVGKNRGISLLRGFPLAGIGSAQGAIVIPSFHPSFINRGSKNLLGVLIRDIQLAVQIAQHGPLVDLPRNYQQFPTIGEAYQYLAFLQQHQYLPVAYDIETDYSIKEPDETDILGRGRNITQIQFSHEPGQAIVFPWSGEYRDVARHILGLANPKWSWNGYSFDDPILEAHGCIIGGEKQDLLWAWHHLQPDLPRGLQFATSFYAPEMGPWKHLADSEIEFYGGCDVDSVQRIGQKIFFQLETREIGRGYQEHVVSLHTILDAMCKRGLPIDVAAQQEFKGKVAQRRQELEEALQSLVPGEIKKSKVYKVLPKDVKERLSLDPDCQQFTTSRAGKQVLMYCNQEGFWVKEDRFNPDSSQQLLAYMKFKKHPVPIDRETKKPTTGKKELERLAKKTGDKLYRQIIEVRELQKIISTYIDGWELGEDDRVHSTFLFAPATGQLSSRDPNIQNAPKQGELAGEFRKTISAGPGKVLVEFDYTAFHALTLGFEASDSDYMRLARLDIHSYLAAHLLGLEGRSTLLTLADDQLAEALVGIKDNHKQVRNYKAKPAILGYGFGLGAAKLYDMNQESMTSKKEAQAILDMLNSLFPKTAAYRNEIRMKAHRQGYLLSRHGYLRHFWDVYHWSYKKGCLVPGDDSEKAIAFLPANDAFGHIKDAMLRLDQRGLLERYGLVNQVHDSLVMEVDTGLVDECLEEVSAEMEKPSLVLVDPVVAPAGLACGIEASLGPDWGSLKTVYKTPLTKLVGEELKKAA